MSPAFNQKKKYLYLLVKKCKKLHKKFSIQKSFKFNFRDAKFIDKKEMDHDEN